MLASSSPRVASSTSRRSTCFCQLMSSVATHGGVERPIAVIFLIMVPSSGEGEEGVGEGFCERVSQHLSTTVMRMRGEDAPVKTVVAARCFSLPRGLLNSKKAARLSTHFRGGRRRVLERRHGAEGVYSGQES